MKSLSKRRCRATFISVVVKLTLCPSLVVARFEAFDPAERHRIRETSAFHEAASEIVEQRELHHRKGRYYEFLNDDSRNHSASSLSDVWLCLACALGWTLWLVNLRQTQQPLVFEKRDSRKVMGHVLQVTLGEDNLGTGIPVYHAVVDYVVSDNETGKEPLQIRKCFTSKKLLDEGFANVEILVLSDDPTTAILLEDFYEQKKEQEAQSPPSGAYLVLIHLVAFILIGGSIFGGVLVILRLNKRLYGWISLGVGIVLLYPAALMLYEVISFLYGIAGPLGDRPGIIIHGERFYCSKKCGFTDALDMFDGDEDGKLNKIPRGALELSQLQVPSMDQQSTSNREVSTPQRLFPNGKWITNHQCSLFFRCIQLLLLTWRSPTSAIHIKLAAGSVTLTSIYRGEDPGPAQVFPP